MGGGGFKTAVAIALLSSGLGRVKAEGEVKAEAFEWSKLEDDYRTYTSRFDKTVHVLKPDYFLDLVAAGTIQVLNKSQLWCTSYHSPSAYHDLAPEGHQLKQASLRIIVDQSKSLASKQKLVFKIIGLLAKIGLSLEVASYTTRHWLGGNSFKLWSKSNTSNPGRINDLLYVECAAVSRHELLPVLNRMIKRSFSKENIDGEALLKLCKPDKPNVVICDNMPADYKTITANADKLILSGHSQNVWRLLNARGTAVLKVNVGDGCFKSWFNISRKTSSASIYRIIKKLSTPAC
ncbi:MAG: cobaltochelatase CobT-related protein [Candidatus Hodgkinia cicadicola]